MTVGGMGFIPERLLMMMMMMIELLTSFVTKLESGWGRRELPGLQGVGHLYHMSILHNIKLLTSFDGGDIHQDSWNILYLLLIHDNVV